MKSLHSHLLIKILRKRNDEMFVFLFLSPIKATTNFLRSPMENNSKLACIRLLQIETLDVIHFISSFFLFDVNEKIYASSFSISKPNRHQGMKQHSVHTIDCVHSTEDHWHNELHPYSLHLKTREEGFQKS